MRTHQEIDERSLELAAAIAAKIDGDPSHAGLEKARKVLDHWEKVAPVPDLEVWRDVLRHSWAEVRQVLLDPSEHGKRLRQSSPFCGILTSRERWAIWRKFAHR